MNFVPGLVVMCYTQGKLGDCELRQTMAHSDPEQDPVLERFLENLPAFLFRVAGRPDSLTFRNLSEYRLRIIDSFESGLRHRGLKIMLNHFPIVTCLG